MSKERDHDHLIVKQRDFVAAQDVPRHKHNNREGRKKRHNNVWVWREHVNVAEPAENNCDGADKRHVDNKRTRERSGSYVGIVVAVAALGNSNVARVLQNRSCNGCRNDNYSKQHCEHCDLPFPTKKRTMTPLNYATLPPTIY